MDVSDTSSTPTSLDSDEYDPTLEPLYHEHIGVFMEALHDDTFLDAGGHSTPSSLPRRVEGDHRILPQVSPKKGHAQLQTSFRSAHNVQIIKVREEPLTFSQTC